MAKRKHASMGAHINTCALKGAHSPQQFLLRKCRFDRHHVGAMPRARNRLGTLVGHVKGLFALASPRTLSLPFFSRCCSPYNPTIPQYLAKAIVAKKTLFSPVQGVKPGVHFSHFSLAHPFVRPSISLVLLLFSQDVSTAMASRSTAGAAHGSLRS